MEFMNIHDNCVAMTLNKLITLSPGILVLLAFFSLFLLCHSAVGSLITLVSVLTNQVTTAVAF